MKTLTKLGSNPVISSALVLSFALLGDTFLYPVLPLHAAALGVPVVWIGFLLSINRFVRMLANPVFAYLFSKVGFRRLTILAALFSVVTTILYGLHPSLSIWILSRLVWGLCFSVLRISSVYYCLDAEKQGISLGINRSLQEICPLLALLVGPVLLEWISPGQTFILLGLFTLPALFYAYSLPSLSLPDFSYNFKKISFPSSFNLLVFVSALIIEGILVVVISKLLRNDYLSVEEVTLLVSIYLLYRRICVVIISPLTGWLADWWGLENMYIGSLLLSVAGLFLIAFDYTQVGIVCSFTFGAVSSVLSPAVAVKDTNNRLRDIAANTTWRDIGAALGALVGGLFLHQAQLEQVFALAAFILIILLFYYLMPLSFTIKQVLRWK
jgi:MFS transporter, DHA1 family, multidrug resistance protein